MRMLRATLLGVTILWGPTGLNAQKAALRDQELLSEYARAYPCPRVVPAAWIRADSSLARSPFCSVVAVAAARLASSPDSMLRWIGTHAVCTPIIQIVYDDMSDGSSGAVWVVRFVVDSGVIADVSFNRVTGNVTIRQSRKRPDDRTPLCYQGYRAGA